MAATHDAWPALTQTLVAWLAAALLLATAVLLAYALRQARAAPDAMPEGEYPWRARSWELLWVVPPLIILGLIAFLLARG